jgi:cadmium resistance protein CadD (predicted permease)
MTALILAFLGTNVDGFLCLAAVFAVDPPRSRVAVLVSCALAFLVLLCVALAASLAIGRSGLDAAWFGAVPAAIGIARLWRLAKHGWRAGDGDVLSSGPSIFSIVLATGADNVAVYTPLFATRSIFSAGIVGIVYLSCWVLGCAALVFATPKLPHIHAWKRYIDPALAVLFVAIGVAIFMRA